MSRGADPFLAATSELTRAQLRSKAYRRVMQGVYVDADATESIELRCRAALLLFPGAVLCGPTAATLQKLPCEEDGVVHLCLGQTAPRTPRKEIVVNRLDIEPDEVMEVSGLPVTHGPRTLADLAAHLDLEALTAVADRVLARYSEAALLQAAARAWGRPGVVDLREAVRRADAGSASPAESRARLRLHDAGFTRMQHGVVVRDGAGGWLAEPDLADPLARVAVQHEGAVHFEGGRSRWLHDLQRDELTRAAGWEVVLSTALDDAEPPELLRKVTSAYLRSAALRGPAVLPDHLRLAA